ncbi:MAG: hypothetical protein GQ544_09250 [Candidatus Aminicenantes bacterium]|nr:hypothetical protein [Candidatus Aminicenantes bacterium]
MAATKRSRLIVLLGIIGVLFNPDSIPGQQYLQRPTITEIEDRLLELVNQSRIQYDRVPLKSSLTLKEIARAHSQDMAKSGNLSHLSISGETYTERLAAQGVLFGPHGENVAFSQTYTAEFIHQSLMDSPEHRHNILESKFDLVGIGIFFEAAKGYYVTQDFVRPLITDYVVSRKDRPGEAHAFLPEEALQANLAQVKHQAKNAFDQIRDSLSLAAFNFIPEVDSLADRFSRSKAEGRDPPAMPQRYKIVPILLLFVTAPSLELALSDIQSIDHARYNSGGLGIRFGRNKDHPGGAYFFTFLLIQSSSYHALSPADWKRIWLDFINRDRKKANLTQLNENLNLSQTADDISNQAQKRLPVTLPSSLAAYAIKTYQTYDLTRFPEGLKHALTTSPIFKLGLGIRYQPDPELPAGSFWITVIYR